MVGIRSLLNLKPSSKQPSSSLYTGKSGSPGGPSKIASVQGLKVGQGRVHYRALDAATIRENGGLTLLTKGQDSNQQDIKKITNLNVIDEQAHEESINKLDSNNAIKLDEVDLILKLEDGDNTYTGNELDTEDDKALKTLVDKLNERFGVAKEVGIFKTTEGKKLLIVSNKPVGSRTSQTNPKSPAQQNIPTNKYQLKLDRITKELDKAALEWARLDSLLHNNSTSSEDKASIEKKLDKAQAKFAKLIAKAEKSLPKLNKQSDRVQTELLTNLKIGIEYLKTDERGVTGDESKKAYKIAQDKISNKNSDSNPQPIKQELLLDLSEEFEPGPKSELPGGVDPFSEPNRPTIENPQKAFQDGISQFNKTVAKNNKTYGQVIEGLNSRLDHAKPEHENAGLLVNSYLDYQKDNSLENQLKLLRELKKFNPDLLENLNSASAPDEKGSIIFGSLKQAFKEVYGILNPRPTPEQPQGSTGTAAPATPKKSTGIGPSYLGKPGDVFIQTKEEDEREGEEAGIIDVTPRKSAESTLAAETPEPEENLLLKKIELKIELEAKIEQAEESILTLEYSLIRDEKTLAISQRALEISNSEKHASTAASALKAGDQGHLSRSNLTPKGQIYTELKAHQQRVNDLPLKIAQAEEELVLKEKELEGLRGELDELSDDESYIGIDLDDDLSTSSSFHQKLEKLTELDPFWGKIGTVGDDSSTGEGSRSTESNIDEELRALE